MRMSSRKQSEHTKDSNRLTKPIFKVENPFDRPVWPALSQKQHDNILTLLCELLAPIGQHRHNQKTQLKTRKSRERSLKRKRSKPTSTSQGSNIIASAEKKRDDIQLLQTTPELTKYLTIGLNSTTKHLESGRESQLSLIFLSSADAVTTEGTPAQLPIQFGHLPSLCSLVSSTKSDGREREGEEQQQTIIIPLSPHGFTRIAYHLDVPRVTALGMQVAAPGGTPLVTYVTDEGIEPVRGGWNGRAMVKNGVAWKETRITTEEILVTKGQTKKRT